MDNQGRRNNQGHSQGHAQGKKLAQGQQLSQGQHKAAPAKSSAPAKPVQRKRRKKRAQLNTAGITFIVLGLGILLIVGVGLFSIIHLFTKDMNKATTESTYMPQVTATPTCTPTPAYDFFEGMHSNKAILIDAENGDVIQSLEADVQAYPASVTKMMTCLVALDYMTNLDMTYTMPQSIYDELASTYHYDLATAGFENGEMVTYRDILYGIMLRSGAECCLAAANICAGSEAAFVDLMNQKAEELGLTNTHFMNCTGYNDPSHFSTASDMAIILLEGLKNDDFRTFITTKTHTSAPTNYHADGLLMENTLGFAMNDIAENGFKILGGKTGYTSDAGQCLASFADIDGHEYVLVTFGAYVTEEQQSTTKLHVADAQLIFGRLAIYIDRTT
ncbi:MAG: D-alanyl-D-alanine carboxypeptidase [Saccharofermentans sp.]|nr:D-alanyl-D-alanine carboxypeptidase [Saccharofermentans sp.]